MPTKEFPFPLSGKNENWRTSSQPVYTSPYLSNVRPYDVLENKSRGGQRPGMEKVFATPVGMTGPYGNKSKNISSFTTADAGAKTGCISTAHGLSNGDAITIVNSTNYAGAQVVSDKTANAFKISVAWVDDDSNDNTMWYITADATAYDTGVYGGNKASSGPVIELLTITSVT